MRKQNITKNGKIIGRPRAEIKQEQFEYLCSIQCTEEEIAGVFKCCEDTLNSWCKDTYEGMTFSEAYKMFSAQGKMSLRRYQFKMAEHNPTMAIWLGKQILGQADVVTIKSVDDSELEELEKLVLIDENDNEKTGD